MHEKIYWNKEMKGAKKKIINEMEEKREAMSAAIMQKSSWQRRVYNSIHI